jgi:hypothetical protein
LGTAVDSAGLWEASRESLLVFSPSADSVYQWKVWDRTTPSMWILTPAQTHHEAKAPSKTMSPPAATAFSARTECAAKLGRAARMVVLPRMAGSEGLAPSAKRTEAGLGRHQLWQRRANSQWEVGRPEEVQMETPLQLPLPQFDDAPHGDVRQQSCRDQVARSLSLSRIRRTGTDSASHRRASPTCRN